MGQKYSYQREMQKEKFLIVQNFMTASEKHYLMRGISILRKHKWCVLTKSANNSTVINKKRKQAIIYLHKYRVNETIDRDLSYEINKWLRYCAETISPVLEPIVDRFLVNYVGLERKNYYIQRVMYMEIPPNEPEQQVHQDGDLGDGTYYIFMPLNYWSYDMGATVFYKDSIVGKIRDIGFDPDRKKGYYQLPNKGFVEGNKFKELYEQARVRKELNLGDITCHEAVTLHNGAENKSSKTRKGLFMIIQAWDDHAEEKFEWVDGLDLNPLSEPNNPLPTIRVAEKNVYSRYPLGHEKNPIKEGGPIDDDPYKHLPDENYEHPETFKAL